MATSPRPHMPSSSQQDESARLYLLDLKMGKKPDIRPDVGPRWLPLVKELEDRYTRTGGNPARLEGVFSTYCHAHPDLDALLHPQPLQGGQEAFGMRPLPDVLRYTEEQMQGACPVLDRYEAFSREASPQGWTEFHPFIGLWAFSVIAGRRVYARIKRKRFYTNLMIAMLSETSYYAKSFTARQAKDVLYACHLSYLLTPNRITPQKLLSDMSGNYVPSNFDELDPHARERVRRRLAMPGQKGMYYDEFGKFVQSMLGKGSRTSEFVDLFLEFDECPPEYETSTHLRGGEPIEKPYFALLGAMTPPNLKANANAGADFWTDGFWARFSFVVAPPPTEDMLPDIEDIPLELDEEEDDNEGEEEENADIPRDLIAALLDWHERLGIPECYPEPNLDKKGEPDGTYTVTRTALPATRLAISPEVRQAWARYRVTLMRLCLDPSLRDFRGSYTRLPETAMRMAVLMASVNGDPRIEIRHWAKAQHLAEILRENLHELYSQVNAPAVEQASPRANLEEDILRQLRRHGPLTLKKIKGSYIKKPSIRELEEALRALERNGFVRREITAHAVDGKYFLVRDDEHSEEGA